MPVWKYPNIHVEKYKQEKCKRVCKESKFIYIYIYIYMLIYILYNIYIYVCMYVCMYVYKLN